MAKKVIVLQGAEGIKFGFGERNVTVTATMAIADAERIQGDYPGCYVEVIEVADEAPEEQPAKPAKTAKTADSTK